MKKAEHSRLFDPSLYQPRIAVDAAGNPIGPPAGGFVQPANVIAQYDLASVPNAGKRVVNSNDADNFGPRIGFAYAPFKSDRLVLRGGYGVFYSRSSLIYLIVGVNAPPLYAVRRSPVGSQVSLADPYVSLPSQAQFPTFVNGVSLAGQVFDRNLSTPYLQQYNASLQFELSSDMLIEASYVGTRGLNLIRSVGINQARLASPQRPIINAVNGRVITTNTADATNVSLRAPYQGVEVGGFLQIRTTAQSTYNSLQLSFIRRMSAGLQFLTAYTFARSIDNSSGTNGGSADAVRDTAIVLGNQLDNRANRGLSDFDRTHRFVTSYLWELPRPAFARKSTLGRWLFSNWQLGGIITAMSGLPIDVVDGGAGSFYGLNGGNNALARPNWARSDARDGADERSCRLFVQPVCFCPPVVQSGQLIPSSNGAAQANSLGTDIGNVGRNVLRGPRQTNVDVSIIKRFRIHEQKRLELRAEFFNLFNQVNFENPIANLNVITSSGGSIDANTGRIINPGDFGRIVATSSNPRLIQFALKLNF